MGMHMWAALTARSCTFFCFENYIAFFMLLGLLAVVASAPQWPVEISFAKEFSALLIIVIAFVAGVNYAADVNYTPYKRAIFNFLKDGLPWLREYIGAPDTPAVDRAAEQVRLRLLRLRASCTPNCRRISHWPKAFLLVILLIPHRLCAC